MNKENASGTMNVNMRACTPEKCYLGSQHKISVREVAVQARRDNYRCSYTSVLQISMAYKAHAYGEVTSIVPEVLYRMLLYRFLLHFVLRARYKLLIFKNI
jgi:hypothetical protein